MELPVIVVPLPNDAGFSVRLAASFEISADGPTVEEAQTRLAELLQSATFRILRTWPANIPAPGEWQTEDEVTQEWLQHIQDYRAECDDRDRGELDQLTDTAETKP